MSLETLSFSEAFKDVTGGNHKVKTNEYLTEGKFPIIDQGKELIAGYVDNKEMLCNATNPCIIFGDHTKIIKFIDFDFVLGADGVKVLQPCEKLYPKYAYHYLKTIKFPEKTGYMRHFKYLKRASVLVPPIDEQKRIAAILDKAGEISNNIEKSQNLRDSFLSSVFLETFGDPILNPKGWEKVILGDIVHFHYGKALKTDERDGNGKFNVYGSNGVVGQHSEKIVDYDTIVIGRKGSVGKVTMALGGGWPIDTTYFVEIKDEGALNLKYLYHSLELANLVRYSITTSIPGINRKTLNSVEIMLPPSQLLSQFERICEIFDTGSTHNSQINDLVNSITQEMLT